ncbi:MAG: tetratricopeptide repeat protein, partial [Dehalococcoidia bacterium]
PLSREYGPPWQIALFTCIVGNVAYERGEYEYSYRLLDEALVRSRAIGDPRLTGFISAYLGRAALKLERSAEIEGILREGAQITQASGDRFGYSLMLEQLALAARAREDSTSAEQLFEASADLFREIGDAGSLARVLISWGDFRRAQGELPEAAELFRQAVKLSLDTRTSPITLSALIGLARVYTQEDKPESALEIAIFVMNHPASSQDTRASAHQICRDLESHLTKDELEAAYQRERADTLEEFVRVHL